MILIVLRIIALLALSVISGFFYRIGGSSKMDAEEEYPWYPAWAVNGRVRDIGCAICAWLGLLALGFHAEWWVHLTSGIILIMANSTYYDKIFGYDNYFAHGAGIGLAYILYAVKGVFKWKAFLIRATALAFFMGLWCHIFDKDTIQENGRGAIQPISLFLLKI
jgi:hypothetical protein